MPGGRRTEESTTPIERNEADYCPRCGILYLGIEDTLCWDVFLDQVI